MLSGRRVCQTVSMSTALAAVIICLILALFAHRNIVSTRTYSVVLGLSHGAATAEVEACFTRLTWANGNGPGLINKARVSKTGRPLVVSVDVICTGTGTGDDGSLVGDEGPHEVRVWISNRPAIAGLTFSNGALKAAQIRARLRRHPAYIRDGE